MGKQKLCITNLPSGLGTGAVWRKRTEKGGMMEIPIKIREEIARRADAHVRSLTDDDFRYILDQWDAWSAGELIEQEKVSEYSMQVERMEAYYRAHGKLPE